MQNLERKRVLVAGATGYIGRAVVRELVARNYEVVALVRRLVGEPVVQESLSGAELRTCDVCHAASLRSSLRGDHFDVVISCLASRSGGPDEARRVERDANLNLLEKAHACEAHFIQLSAICMQKPVLAGQRSRQEFENILQESGLRYSIVRPTDYFKSLLDQLESVKRGKPFVIFGDGDLTASKPIAQAELALFIVDCIGDADKHNQVLPVGGPGPALTPRQQGELLFRLLGRRERFRRVSLKRLERSIAVLDIAARLVPGLRTRAEQARIDHYHATESMLVWDAEAGRYDAEATPEFGTVTLEAFYRRVLEEEQETQGLGQEAILDR